jgi:hypothetical protein
MKKLLWLIVPGLLVSLFIYLFYRTDKTVVNDIFMAIFSRSTYYGSRSAVNRCLPLPDILIYSLPEGLWVFCITLTSKPYYLKAARLQFNLMYLPLIFSVGLELLQLVHITNGRFDWLDIASSVLFWAIGMRALPNRGAMQNALHPFTAQSLLCLVCYVIVYFAHVWK